MLLNFYKNFDPLNYIFQFLLYPIFAIEEYLLLFEYFLLKNQLLLSLYIVEKIDFLHIDIINLFFRHYIIYFISFTNIDNWRKDFLSSLGPKDPDTFPFVLVGNKSDMKDDIKVNNEEIEAYCKEHNNMPYFATSAKEDIGLDETFNKVADLAYERIKKNDDNFIPEKPTYLKVSNQPKKKGCCGGKN